jgi:fatty acid desaturase
MDNDRNALVFFGFWMILVVANMIFMFTSRNAALKRVVAGIGTALVSVLLLGATLLMGQPWLVLPLIPVLAFVVFFNGRQIRFCDACGMTNTLANPFKSEAFCSDCGKPLDLTRVIF